MYTDEKEHLMKDEEAYNVEVYEVTPEEPTPSRCRQQRPLWRKIVRVLFTFILFTTLWLSFGPVLTSFFSCNHHQRHFPSKDGSNSLSLAPKMKYEFSGDQTAFWIKQDSQSKVPTRTSVHGNVIVVPNDGETTVVTFHFNVTDTRILDDIKITPKKNGIVWSADTFSLVPQTVNATVRVALGKNDALKKLYVGTKELNIHVGKGVDNEFKGSSFASTSGDIAIYGTHNAGCSKLRTVSGNVYGEFNLWHAVDVGTVSGNIGIRALPQEHNADKCWLGTKTVSGSTKVHVVHPLNARALKSQHSSGSGNVTVRYPEEWQGTLKMKTTSGAFETIGKNLNFVKKRKTPKGQYWKLVKGDGVSRALVESISGHVQVSVGDV